MTNGKPNGNGNATHQAAQASTAVAVLELAPRSDWSALKEAEHFVQFYESDEFLLNSLGSFIGTGLVAGEACVVVATSAHRARLEECLQGYGLDMAAARATGQYVALDAAEVLAKFMVDGTPEQKLFVEVLENILARAAAGGRRVRIFGEMVALLWAGGKEQAAIRLEEFWNELSKDHPFMLFCAYPMNGLGGAALAEPFDHVCRAHSHVIPAESYNALADPGDRLRLIVQLQQQARSLQAEIAEREKAEARLRRSQQELRDFVENAVVPLHWVGPDGLIIWANRAEMDMLGYSREEYIGRHIAEFHADPPVIEDILQCLTNGQELHGYEARLRCKDGSIKYALIDSNVYREDGQFIHTRCFTRDITDRKQAEQALRKNEARLQAMFSQAAVGIVVVDLAGRLLEANDRMCQIVGRSREQLLTLTCADLTHPDDWNCNQVLMEEVAAGKRDEFIIEKRYSRPNGSWVWVGVTVSPLLDEAGRPERLLAIVQDIDARKRAEEVVRQANRRKDEFLAMLAHELRNPLAPIRSAVQLLHRLGPPAPELQQARDVIDRQTQHLTRLVDDLLDTSRITQGKITLRKEKLELMSVVGRALETSRPLIEERNHQLHLALPQEPLRLEGDLVRLAQVLSNLLNNAAKYTEEGGHIYLTAERADNEIVLRVRDDGVGIAAPLLPHIFDLFTQADRSLDRSEGGLGVGLALVRSLVELHGGRVEAFSDGPDQGSEFVVRLPMLSKAAPETKTAPTVAAEHAPAPKGCCRVLVVDDNVDSAECMALLLRLSGHEVLMAHDGPTAIDAARMFKPQVVLLDIGLPKMDGYEVARRLREWPELQRAVFIALTGYGRTEDQRLSKQAGFDHHLVKPVDPDAVEALVNSLVLS